MHSKWKYSREDEWLGYNVHDVQKVQEMGAIGDGAQVESMCFSCYFVQVKKDLEWQLMYCILFWCSYSYDCIIVMN